MDTEQLSMTKKALVGVQFLFVAFGATVLVPLLIGIDPATALFTAGVGTFLFHFITKGKVPIFLGSSFAFIAPIIAATKQWGLPGTIAGLTSVSLVYFAMSALVKWQGKKLLDRIFPPVVIGPAIILIGLSLSGSAVDMAKTNWILSFASLITAILVLTFCKGLMKLVPIISGGYRGLCHRHLHGRGRFLGRGSGIMVLLSCILRYHHPFLLGSIPLYVARGNSSGAGAYRRCICGECRSQEGFRGRSGIASHDVGRWTGMSLFSLSGRTS